MKLSEDEIRPSALEAGKIKAFHADLERLSKHKSNFVAVVCPACETESGEPGFEKYGFNFDKCPNCGTAYMNPRATPEILAEFYAGSILYDYWDRYIFPASRKVRMEQIFHPRVERIIQLCQKFDISHEVLLEVGCAGGMFCEEALASSQFGRVIGIEPSASQAATCRKIGVEVIEATVEQANDVHRIADIVASFETIEHVYSPKTFLQSCKNILKPNGLLVLTCPNYEGFDIATLGALSDSLDAEHVNMLTPRGLKDLFESLEFEVLELTTPGKLDAELVRKKAIEGKISLEGQPFLEKVLLTDWETLGPSFQTYLSENLLSSHMWAVARFNSD